MSHSFQFVSEPRSKKTKAVEYTVIEEDEDAQTSSNSGININEININ